jgi:hypothetical protein
MTDKYVKNIDIINHTYQGQVIEPSDYYLIPSTDELKWMNDSNLLTDIGSSNALMAKDDSGTEDITDINEGINFLKNIVTTLEIDDEGRQVSRSAYGKKGWTYLAHPIEFTTAKKDSVFSEDYTGTDRTDYVLKFYDNNGDEITSGLQIDLDNDCVETRITLSPGYDYEIISGMVDIHSSITENVRLWVIGGIIDTTTYTPWEYPAASGIYHIKEFAGGINFKYIGVDQKMETDGRASKFMCKDKTGIPYPANQFQFIIKHPAGSQNDFMITLEYYRA